MADMKQVQEYLDRNRVLNEQLSRVLENLEETFSEIQTMFRENTSIQEAEDALQKVSSTFKGFEKDLDIENVYEIPDDVLNELDDLDFEIHETVSDIDNCLYLLDQAKEVLMGEV